MKFFVSPSFCLWLPIYFVALLLLCLSINKKSINPTKVEGPFSIENLVSDQSKKRNKYFNFCMDKKSSLNTILFLAFHNVPLMLILFLVVLIL